MLKIKRIKCSIAVEYLIIEKAYYYSFRQLPQNGVIDGVSMYTGVKSKNLTSKRVTGYFAVVLAKALACEIKIPRFILTRRTMSVAFFIFRLNLPSSDASIRQKASLLRTSRTFISTPLISIMS